LLNHQVIADVAYMQETGGRGRKSPNRPIRQRGTSFKKMLRPHIR